MKKTQQNTCGTSYFHFDIATTVNKLIALLGEPQHFENDGIDKVNMHWDLETSDGIVFTIYDWKEYRPLGFDEIIHFHIGGYSAESTSKAQQELFNLLYQ